MGAQIRQHVRRREPRESDRIVSYLIQQILSVDLYLIQFIPPTLIHWVTCFFISVSSDTRINYNLFESLY